MKKNLRILIPLLLIAGLFSVVWLNIQYTDVVKDMYGDRARLQELQRLNEQQEIKIARSVSYAELEKKAITQLGMEPAHVVFIMGKAPTGTSR